MKKLLIHAVKHNTAEARYDMLEGRQHLVVPTVMMVEGVHKGSGGPIYYSEQELQRNVNMWDHKPVVVYHPEINGKGVTACSQTILNTQKIGVMLNTSFKDGKLTTESWIDVERANAVDKRVVEAINNKSVTEVSTGVYADATYDAGEWNGEAYDAVASNLSGDHLAVLPDQIGACSTKDGAGLLRNQAQQETANGTDSLRRYNSDFRRVLALNGLILNDISFSNISSGLWAALKAKLGSNWDGWIEDTYPKFVVYSQGGKYYRLGYSVEDNEVELDSGPPEEVVRVTEYRTVSGTFIGNQDKRTEAIMTKVDMVNALIKNNGWQEKDRTYLMSQSEDDLKKYDGATEETPPAETTTGAAVAPQQQVQNSAQQPQQQPALTVDQYLAGMPAPMRAMMTNALASQAKEKTRLVGIIKNSKGNLFTDAWLNDEARSPEELQGIVSLIEGQQAGQQPGQGYQPQVPVLNTSGQQMGTFAAAGAGGIIMNTTTTTQQQPQAQTPLVMNRSQNMFRKEEPKPAETK